MSKLTKFKESVDAGHKVFCHPDTVLAANTLFDANAEANRFIPTGEVYAIDMTQLMIPAEIPISAPEPGFTEVWRTCLRCN